MSVSVVVFRVHTLLAISVFKDYPRTSISDSPRFSYQISGSYYILIVPGKLSPLWKLQYKKATKFGDSQQYFLRTGALAPSLLYPDYGSA